MAEITIYTVENCPKCEMLKSVVSYPGMVIEDMSQPATMATLRCNNVFTLAAPILEINGKFLTVDQLFNKDDLNIELLSKLLSDTLRDDIETACNRLRGEGWDYSADIIDMIYKHNQNFKKDRDQLKKLNDELMGHCNNLRKQLKESKP